MPVPDIQVEVFLETLTGVLALSTSILVSTSLNPGSHFNAATPWQNQFLGLRVSC